MEDLVRKFQGLSQEWNKKNHNLALCQEKLENLTLDLTRFSYMPRQESLATKRDTLEIGAILSLEKRDMVAFERYMTQLKCYYCDYKLLSFSIKIHPVFATFVSSLATLRRILT
ncbi:26S proteasome non-ATPase regulatory subunit 8 [Sparganum proliferum]